MIDYLLTDGGLYVLAAITALLALLLGRQIRRGWHHAHAMSERRVMAVQEYTRDFRIYVPTDWEREGSR